jgi:putative endonuclease
MSLLRPQRLRLRLLERFVEASNRLAVRFARAPEGPRHLEVGRQGEEAAYFYLRRQGYIVVARAWRSAKLRGDLDLVAWQGSTLCFIEVKARTSREIATAESAVDQEKIQMLRRMARQYLQGLSSPPEDVRFDVLAVYFEGGEAPEFEFYPRAFDWYG